MNLQISCPTIVAPGLQDNRLFVKKMQPNTYYILGTDGVSVVEIPAMKLADRVARKWVDAIQPKTNVIAHSLADMRENLLQGLNAIERVFNNIESVDEITLSLHRAQ